LAYFVLAVALAISAVAAYYSIIGLVTIFSAAVLPVVIMGSVLEIGKLTTTVWLHRYWKQATWWLKTYLTMAVVVLMLITSMGIFGFLSKAHIQQTAEVEQNASLVVRIEQQIETQKNRIEELENVANVQNEQQNAQIVQNEKQIEQINSRYETLVSEQNTIIEEARGNLALLEKFTSENDIEALQVLVGVRADGRFGPGTARAVEAFREREEASSTRIVSQAREEIRRLRELQNSEVSRLASANGRLQNEIGTVSVDREAIEAINQNVLELEQEKFELETEFRKLEAEFGPVKYIAELIYGAEQDDTTLDKAVRVVILLLIFVFDPLAVLLLIASQYTLAPKKDDKPSKNETVEFRTTPKKVQTKFKEVEIGTTEVEYDKEKDEIKFNNGKLKGFKPDV
jgi:hypothetical protein